jgi:hypothetical protein
LKKLTQWRLVDQCIPTAHVSGAALAGTRFRVRDIKVEIPATPLELPDRSTWRYPRSSAFIGG